MVALVRGVHGLRGAVRVEVLTDRPEERFSPGATLHREGTNEPLTIATAEAIPDGPGWRLRFDEVSDRSVADTLRDVYLEAETGATDLLRVGEYYWHQVMGATVRDLQDRPIGVVHDVYRVGGAEVFVVRGELYGEFDLPVVRAFIRIFAPARGEIVVDVDALGLEPAKPPRQPRTPRARKGDARRLAAESAAAAAAEATLADSTGAAGAAADGSADPPQGPPSEPPGGS